MSSTALASLQAIGAIFGPIALGLSMGVLTRRTIAQPTQRQVVARWCDNLALKLLLPFFIIEAIRRQPPSLELALAAGVGFSLPLLMLGLVHLYRLLPIETDQEAVRRGPFPFLVSTFGGGNRGTALFILLLFNEAHFAEYLKWFSLVDLGNFLCQYTVVAVVMARAYAAPSPSGRGWRLLFDNYAVFAFLVVVAYLSASALWPALESFLQGTVTLRKTLFSVLIFTALAIRFDTRAAGAQVLRDLLRFAALRGAMLVIALVVLSAWLPASLPLTLAVGVLAIMPPSSAVPSMLAQVQASERELAYASSLSAATNLLYVVAVVLGGLIALTRIVG